MLKMGFHVKWINLMMSCVHSVSYSIIINGKPRGHITPHMGFAPRGPPSLPTYFYLCRGFIRSFNEICGGWFTKRGSSMPKRANNITLVFFFFCR